MAKMRYMQATHILRDTAMTDDAQSIENLFPTRRASCGMVFHDLERGGIACVCNQPPGHGEACSNVTGQPQAISPEQSADKQKLNQHYGDFMRSILPGFFDDKGKK